MTESIRLTRQELYDRVWSSPAWKLGPEFGLSGRGPDERCTGDGTPSLACWDSLVHIHGQNERSKAPTIHRRRGDA